MFPPSFCIVILYFLLQLISQLRFIIFTNFLCLLQSLTVNNLYLGSGVDNTGVPTKMVTMNCSLKISVYNPATLFGIHVSSSPINLMYSKISMANGQVNFHVPFFYIEKEISVNQINQYPTVYFQNLDYGLSILQLG